MVCCVLVCCGVVLRANQLMMMVIVWLFSWAGGCRWMRARLSSAAEPPLLVPASSDAACMCHQYEQGIHASRANLAEQNTSSANREETKRMRARCAVRTCRRRRRSVDESRPRLLLWLSARSHARVALRDRGAFVKELRACLDVEGEEGGGEKKRG